MRLAVATQPILNEDRRLEEKEEMILSICMYAFGKGLASRFKRSARPAAFALVAMGLLILSGCTSSNTSSKLQVGTIAFTDANGKAQTSLTSITAGQGTNLEVTLTNDSKLLGADWSAVCGSALSPGTPLPVGQTQDLSCGSFTPTHTTSGPVPSYAASGAGYVTFYTAPAAPPKNGTVTLYASSTSDPSRYSSVTLTVTGLPISIGFAPAPPTSLAAGGTAQLKAVLSNDYTTAGATWSVACASGACGSFSSVQTASGAATTYTAPTNVPFGGGAVIVTATSVADSSKFVSATIQTAPISVSISPATLSVATNGIGSLSATVTNDGANKGVDWSVSCTNTTNPGNCGTITLHTASGAAATYTAPSLSKIAVGNTIAITATSTTDPTKSATATVTTTKGQFVSGTAQAAQQPISGASISLYAVTTSASVLSKDVSAGTESTITSATTAEDGNFTIPYGYECPTSGTEMYLVSTGGNAGGGTNDNLALMAALGPCANLDQSRFVVNEATTAAAVYALTSFISDYRHIGSSGTSPTAITAAFDTAQDLVDVKAGEPRSHTVSGKGAVPLEKINTLADILNSCAVTAGSVPGDGGVCDQLFAAVSPSAAPAQRASNSLQAMPALAKIAMGQVDDIALYRLASSSSAFQPILDAQPTDWTLPVTYTSAPISAFLTGKDVSVDSAGNVWVRDGENGATEFVGASSSVVVPSTLIPLAAATTKSLP